MRYVVPRLSPVYDRLILQGAFDELSRALLPLSPYYEAVPELLIYSPDKRTWRLSVSNGGVLQVTAWTPPAR